MIACALKVGKTLGNKFQTFSESGLFLIKRHPTKYMHIEKSLTEKHHYAINQMSNLRVIVFAAIFLASRLCVTSLKKWPKKKTPSLIPVDVNKNFNLHMYLRTALLLQNKLLL